MRVCRVLRLFNSIGSISFPIHGKYVFKRDLRFVRTYDINTSAT